MDTNELNRVLSDEIYKLRSGKTKPDRMNAVVRGCSGLISNARLQLQYFKLVGGASGVKFFGNTKPALKGEAKRLPDKKK